MVDRKMMVFDDKEIRKVWHNDDWWFSIVDIVAVLSESPTPRRYWGKVKARAFDELQLSPIWGQLKMPSSDGKMYMTDCADTKGILRIIQSIPSKKAESFKIWLAKVGSERLDEEADPELAVNRAMKNYLALGYNEKWINQRLRTIEARKELTDEWKRSGVNDGFEFSILTNEMMRAWSGKSIREYKEFKNLKKENLRDNMTTLELALNILAEATTAEISKVENPEGLDESLEVAREGGEVAGNARRDIEERTGKDVISSVNSKELIEKNKMEIEKNE
ncbi:hypothetical protein KAS08_05570 [Candidatus Pacearchaeota archaeon]|nr:hypothetical protein [Candidatus Pacearchaeota archaeon]